MPFRKPARSYPNYHSMRLRKSKYDNNGLFNSHWLAFKQAIALLSHHIFGFIVLVFFVSILLSVPLTLVYAAKMVNHIGAAMNTNAQMSVYLKPGLNQTDTKLIINKINQLDNIRFVQYISPEQGLKAFEQESGIKQLTNYLDGNPIPGVIITRATGDQPAMAVTKIANDTLGQLPGVTQVMVNNQWLANGLAFIDSIEHSLLIATLVAFFLVFVIITTLLNLLLPESLIDTTKRTMVYLGLLLGVVTGLIADFAVSHCAKAMSHITQQLGFLNSLTTQHSLGFVTVTINQLLAWVVLISAAIIVRRYRIMSYRTN